MFGLIAIIIWNKKMKKVINYNKKLANDLKLKSKSNVIV